MLDHRQRLPVADDDVVQDLNAEHLARLDQAAVELFGEFLFNRRETYQNGWRQFWNFGYTGDLYGTGTPATLWADGFTGVNFLSPTGITDLARPGLRVAGRQPRALGVRCGLVGAVYRI